MASKQLVWVYDNYDDEKRPLVALTGFNTDYYTEHPKQKDFKVKDLETHIDGELENANYHRMVGIPGKIVKSMSRAGIVNEQIIKVLTDIIVLHDCFVD